MKESTKIEILLRECENTNQKIERFVGNQFLYTQGTLILAGGYVVFLIDGTTNFEKAIAVSEGVQQAGHHAKFYIQFLPYVLLTVLMGIAYQYQRTIGLQGYKQYLEELINKKAGENLISYGHIGMNLMVKRNVIGKANSMIYALLYIASVALARTKPPGDISDWYLITHIGFAALLIIVVYWQTRNFTHTVKKAAEDINKSKEKVSKVKV